MLNCDILQMLVGPPAWSVSNFIDSHLLPIWRTVLLKRPPRRGKESPCDFWHPRSYGTTYYPYKSFLRHLLPQLTAYGYVR